MSEEEMKSREYAELRLLYDVSVRDLAFFKRQQWVVTNYGILLYATAFGVYRYLLPNVASWERCLLVVFGAGILIAALLIIFNVEKSIQERKDRLIAIRKLFTPGFNDVWNAGKKPNDGLTLFPALTAVLVLGCGILLWLIYAR
jgi:hypothetical protein